MNGQSDKPHASVLGQVMTSLKVLESKSGPEDALRQALKVHLEIQTTLSMSPEGGHFTC